MQWSIVRLKTNHHAIYKFLIHLGWPCIRKKNVEWKTKEKKTLSDSILGVLHSSNGTMLYH